MSNIDDIFKKGLEGEGLEYSSASWAAMEGLLPAKKIGFLAKYKWALGVIVMVAVGAIYFSWETEETNEEIVEAPKYEVFQNSQEPSTLAIQEAKNDQKEELSSQLAATALQEESQAALSPFEREHGTNVIQIIEEEVGAEDLVNAIASERDAELERYEEMQVESVENIDANSIVQPSGTETSEIVSTRLDDNVEVRSIGLTTIPFSDVKTESIKVEDFESVKSRNISWSVSPFMGIVDYSRSQNLQGIADDFGFKASEKELNSLEYGVRIGVNRKKWSIVSGLEFLELNENVSYSAPVVETSYQTKKMISNANFTTTSRGTRVALMSDVVIDSTENTVDKPICQDCDFKVSYVRIPFNVQYNFGSGRLQYFGNAGASLLHATNVSGTYSIGENTALEIRDISSADITRNMIQIDASLGAKYRILKNLSAWGSINLSQGTVSMLNTYEQVPELRSIRVGLEIRL